MFSCGINIYRLILPSIALSILITGTTFVVNELLVPAANYQVNKIQVQFIDHTVEASTSKLIIYPEYAAEAIQSLFFAENFSNQTAENIIVLYWSNQILERIITADRGKWNAQQQFWYLSDSQVYQRNKNGKLQLQTNLAKSQLNYSPLPIAIANLQRSPAEMNITQAFAYINLLELTNNTSGSSMPHQQLKLYKIRTHQKIAFPFICLIFAIVGSALGSQYNYSSRIHCFGVCLLIVFLYYTVCFLAEALAVVNFLPIIISTWLPNFLGLLIGAKLMDELN
jgi:lipopolysaccharide export system permease protein